MDWTAYGFPCCSWGAFICFHFHFETPTHALTHNKLTRTLKYWCGPILSLSFTFFITATHTDAQSLQTMARPGLPKPCKAYLHTHIRFRHSFSPVFFSYTNHTQPQHTHRKKTPVEALRCVKALNSFSPSKIKGMPLLCSLLCLPPPAC